MQYNVVVEGHAPSRINGKLDSHNKIMMRKDPHHKIDMAHELNTEAKAWKTIWSAGQGVGSIHEVLPVADLVSRLKSEFHAASEAFAAKAKLYGL